MVSLVGFVGFVVQAATPRVVSTSFDFDWRFHLGSCNGAERIEFDDSAWRKVDVPHDYQIEMPWNEKAGKARGFKDMSEGWYRKTFSADEKWKGARIEIDFEGVECWCDVWLNGQPVGGCDNGYLGFAVDITNRLRYDRPNVIAVRASTGAKTVSRWYTGGGIYRNVRLNICPPRGFSRHGLCVRTSNVTADSAEVDVVAELDGFKNDTNRIELAATVYAPSGRVVAQTKGRLTDFVLAHPEVNLEKIMLKRPQLWSPGNPLLYTVEATVFRKGVALETKQVRFGIRDVCFGPDFGFRLNGRKVFVMGVANHHDHGALGAADYRRDIERYVRTLKRFGFNLIRTSHNPYSPTFLDVCDELGMLVVDEWSDKWSDGINMNSRVPFSQLFPTSVPEWIRRDRNHPSVILWSLGNELQHRAENSGFLTDDWGVTTYRILDVLVKRYDPTRLTTVAQYPAARNAVRHDSPENRIENNPEPSPLLVATDVASQNYKPNLYGLFKRKHPGLILFQSEASTQALLQPMALMDRKSSVGAAYWGAVSYWGESDGWPKKGWDYSWFSHDLEPRPQAYLFKSYAKPDEPVAKIGVQVGKSVSRIWNDMTVGRQNILSTWNFPKGFKKVQKVVVYTNGDEAELFVNGRSLGVRSPGKEATTELNVATWKEVAYEPGVIKAVVRKNGCEYAHDEIVTTGNPVRLVVEAENADVWKADGIDLLFVRIRAVDAEGRTVPDADASVAVKVSGAARLLALDDGNQHTDSLPTDNPKKLHQGRLLAILRADRKPGAVQLSVSSERFPTVRCTFQTLTR